MDITVTTTILVTAFVITAAANYMSRRPVNPDRIWPIPYNGIQFVGILVIVLMLAHMVTLLSGKPFTGRMG
jgi:multisubunit Na+/H+ antiporter MnhE subunit